MCKQRGAELLAPAAEPRRGHGGGDAEVAPRRVCPTGKGGGREERQPAGQAVPPGGGFGSSILTSLCSPKGSPAHRPLSPFFCLPAKGRKHKPSPASQRGAGFSCFQLIPPENNYTPHTSREQTIASSLRGSSANSLRLFRGPGLLCAQSPGQEEAAVARGPSPAMPRNKIQEQNFLSGWETRPSTATPSQLCPHHPGFAQTPPAPWFPCLFSRLGIAKFSGLICEGRRAKIPRLHAA